MFHHLKDFNRKRTAKEAVGFYIAYLCALVLVAIVIAFIVEIIVPQLFSGGTLATALQLGTIIATICCTALAYIILGSKGRLEKVSTILYLIGALILGYFGGAALDMVLVSYLTTLDSVPQALSPETPS